jgi:inorganic pyrophosphatase/exopolyphosphatase
MITREFKSSTPSYVKLSDYLDFISNLISRNNTFKKIYLLNNSSCDIDSFISSIILSFAKNFSEDIIKQTTENKYSFESNFEFSSEGNKLYIPLMNCRRGDLKNRFDICFVFEKFNFHENQLFYISDFKENKNQTDAFSEIELILVDHNQLDISLLMIFQPNQVVEIYDHHSDVNSNFNQYPNLLKKNLKFPLGSCSTLILMDYFVSGSNKILSIFDPLFLVSAILLDTNYFKQGWYKNRWVDLDRFVFKYILEVHNVETSELLKYYTNLKEKRKNLDAYLDLGIPKLLELDFKIFIWGKIEAHWSSLQIYFQSLIKKFEINELISEIKSKIYNNIMDCSNRIFLMIARYKDPISFKKCKIILIYANWDDTSKSYYKDSTQFKKNLKSELVENFIELENYSEFPKLISIKLTSLYTRKILEPILRKFFAMD